MVGLKREGRGHGRVEVGEEKKREDEMMVENEDEPERRG